MKNKKNMLLLASLFATTSIFVVGCSDDTNEVDNQEKINNEQSINSETLNKEKIITIMNKLVKEQDSILGQKEEFIKNQDVLLTVKYREAAFYHKYFLNQLAVLQSKKGEYKFENMKFAYKGELLKLFSLEEKDFNQFIEEFSKGLDKSEFKGESISDVKLVDELNEILKEESELLKYVYDNYELNEKGHLVLKKDGQILNVDKLSNLDKQFYNENELSNFYVQFSVGFEMFNNSLVLHGKPTEEYLIHLLQVLNSPAYYDFAALDEQISNLTYSFEADKLKLNDSQRDLFLNLINKNLVSLETISDNNFYKKQIVQTLNRFEKLVLDEEKTFKEITNWYVSNPNDILMFSRDSVKNSFFMITE